MDDILNINEEVEFSDTIARLQEHTITPQAGTNYGNLGEIRLEFSNLNVNTLPSKSYLYLEGKFLTAADATPTKNKISNNGFAFLFDEARYELHGVEIDRTRNVGITTTLKNYVSLSPTESAAMLNAGWNPDPKEKNWNDDSGNFGVCIPLKNIFGFAEDYDKILVHARQQITLIRSADDKNCYQRKDAATAGDDCKIVLTHVSWHLPFVQAAPRENLRLLNMVEKGSWVKLPFRTWELFEHPALPASDSQSWTIKSTTQLEKPRYIIVGFQTGRKGSGDVSASEFDACDLTDIKLFINEEVYPYGNLNINFTENHYARLYHMYAKFRQGYYGKGVKPLLNPETYKSKAPIAVIDCSHQDDTLKTGPVNFRLEFRAKKAFPANTTAFALVIHDKMIDYNLLNNTVSRV